MLDVANMDQAAAPAPALHAVGPSASFEAAFLFADVAGFSAFTERHGDVRAAELALRLRDGVRALLPEGAHVVKTIGDAVMVRFEDPAAAVAAGLRIVAQALPAPEDPPLRVGVHCGPAVETEGDFFGASVNLAARLASVAAPGEVLMSTPVAAAARVRGIETEDRGERGWWRSRRAAQGAIHV